MIQIVRLACALALVAGLGEARAAAPPASATYVNPVLNADFPDPMVLRDRDGWYYAYSTQTVTPRRTVNVQLARSRDLVHWAPLPDAMPVKPAWAGTTQNFWAPHVLEDHGTYYMYFSAESGNRDGMCVGVATAKSPRGPFVDSGKPLVCGGGFANIDPCPFDDPKSGKKLLYWGSGFEPIRVRELGGDRLAFAPGSRETAVLWPSRDQYEALIEGAWVAYRDGFYYLFYSGDNCCGDQASYAVAVARSESPLGPFIKRNYMRGGPNSAILQGNARWRAPGHNAVVKDGKGQEWIVYHAIDLKQPYLPGGKTTRRPLLIDRLLYHNGWPEVPGGTPSTGKQPAPTP